MNKAQLKNYAPLARREFIQAVTDRAHHCGLSKGKQEPVRVEGDFAIITGRAFPKAVAQQRAKLEERIAAASFEQVMEEIAYTWFNRLVAMRYMELHGYFSHGYRVLSHPEPNHPIPEILEKAQFVELPGLDKAKVLELKLAGNQDEALYRLLLMAQCNELHRAMPFLFEAIQDCTELLLPDNLIHSDSLIRKLVNEIEQADWQEVEIIGWLYQFYISEKKDQVIGSVVKSEDIPAATQLFTPNWIVKYLVQNSLGAQWMRTYPQSPLQGKMAYYIAPAEQSPDVQQQLKAITPDSLNPEELTLLDPACGSGHILVEAYDLLKEIYLERGFRKRDIAELILKKNLFGLEIDDRAAQLAGFAVMMKARGDDRQIFDRQVQPHIVSIQETKELDFNEIVRAINAPLTEKDVDRGTAGDEFEFMDEVRAPLFASLNKPRFSDEEKLTVDDLKALLGLFEHGKTFGSLIRIPEALAQKLPAMAARVNTACKSGLLNAQTHAQRVLPFIKQALLMASHYDAVVANPPYMGGKFFTKNLKDFVVNHYKNEKGDLYSSFIRRNIEFAKNNGAIGMITIPNWMFLSTFESLREFLIENNTIDSFVHNGRGVWGSDFGSCSFVIKKTKLPTYIGTFKRLFDKQGSVSSNEELKERFFLEYKYFTSMDDFKKIPGSPIAYWVSDRLRQIFEQGTKIVDIFDVKQGMATSDNSRFLRLWHEVSYTNTKFDCSSLEESKRNNEKWYPYNKGGDFKRWYGNNEYVVNWWRDGKELKEFQSTLNQGWHVRLKSRDFYFKPSINWSFVSSAYFGVRYSFSGFIFDVGGSSAFPSEKDMFFFIGYLCSKMAFSFMQALNPTLNFQVENVGALPILLDKKIKIQGDVDKVVWQIINVSKADWDSYETSWDFEKLPLLEHKSSLGVSYKAYSGNCQKMTAKMKELEEENNRLFIEAYGLQDELTPDVPEEQITLFANPKYRYGGNLSDEELESRFKEDTIKELVSYAVGCMMGRYSLDEPGLIYAHSGNEGFDASKYKTFPADHDGIIPITDFTWFDDDTAERFFKFVETVWGKQTLDENLDFAAEAIGRKASDSSREAIRRYFCNDFFKDHLQRYKRRPIYWLFTSGKEKAFQGLVYLHRYNEGTLSRMRTEYVIPLQGRMNSRIEMLKTDAEQAGSTSAANKLRKERTTLEKQAEELRKFDEKLRHYADRKIKLDLDDGVKVNYGKFGDLLAEVKAVAGSADD